MVVIVFTAVPETSHMYPHLYVAADKPATTTLLSQPNESNFWSKSLTVRQSTLAEVRVGVRSYWGQVILGSGHTGVRSYWGQVILGSGQTGTMHWKFDNHKNGTIVNHSLQCIQKSYYPL